ncbi:phage holin family protein [Paractinoplanes rishiriensis]|uniref:Membrane protein n=1 Tax=Paractinoplanes rishiriensis TaxID=1050105 RepID=A0A919K3V2_9ACTN|nr:alkaline phosphatase family protein [Actinoplanes rishiriensis]GIE98485.1 membrane protein [Actinoplanes rishiriensis]
MNVPRAAGVVLLGWAALAVTFLLLPGLSADSGWQVLVAAVLIGLFGVALRPAAVALLTRVGWLGVVAGWLLAEAAFVYAALTVIPGISVDGFGTAFWASWIFATLMSAGLWLITAGQPGIVTTHLIRSNRRFRGQVPHTDTPGVVIVQIDGLSAPLARWAFEAGNLPTLGRWLRSGSHTLDEWHAQLPATTPASQAGLLHGGSDQVPAFRWYEKESGRLVVTNQPADATLVESRLSDGRGLLAGGGVSVSNVFSGDAATSLLTMSTVAARSGPKRYLSAYLLDPFGLTRSLVLTLGEIVKELYQARRQRLRRVEPRIHRSGSYVLLRGATNVLLRHLNVTILAEHMMRGAPVLYCDFVDYDEIAHHAGPARPESLAALEGIDGILAELEEVAVAAPRPYHFVVLSDHGQSQGATFRQRYGIGLDRLLRDYAGQVLASGDDEQEGRARALRAGLMPTPADAVDEPPERPEFVVAASGNLALVYLARRPGRQTLEQIEELYPEMLDKLVTHPGIGWIAVRSAEHGPVVLGGRGRRLLDSDRVVGGDPLLGFGPYAAADLRRHDRLAHAPDLLVNSSFDPVTQEVAAFEELVGCHGGMGGWQDRPVLVHPRAWPVELDLTGADAVHEQLCRWLEKFGARSSSGGDGPAAARADDDAEDP